MADGICPHCGAPLTENTVLANPYIEEGYLKSWNLYREWLAGTLNHALLILELGVDFKTPTVIRWPFEKTVFFNPQIAYVSDKPEVLPDCRRYSGEDRIDSAEFGRLYPPILLPAIESPLSYWARMREQ